MCKVVKALALTVLALALTGCGQEKMPEVKSLTIGTEGEILHHIVGKLDQNYYQIQIADVESFATGRVEEYCADHGEKTVTLEAVEEKKGNVSLDFRYASAEDYSGFNHRILYVGSLAGASDEGYVLEAVPFVSTEGQAAEIGYIEEWEKKQMIVLETRSGEDMLLNLPGKTLYINQSAHNGQEITLVGKKSVMISNREDEGTASFSYIIYE